MMTNILIPTDFSENSWNAIAYSIKYFEKSTCNFYILHVTPIINYASGETPPLPFSGSIEKELLKQSKSDLQDLLNRIKKIDLNPNHNFITIPSYDYFIDSIRGQIDKKKIDLVVMATKGASGIKKIVIGSNTGDLITKVKIPVMVIPEKAIFKVPKEIAFPTDYNIFYHTKIISDILEFSKKHDTIIRVVHVAKKNEELTQFQLENKEYLDEVLSTINHSFHRISNKKIEAGIECFVESRDIDMIFMVAKNLTLFQQVMFKPTVEEISYRTKIPFIVLHE
ncbi:universal stress protein [Aureibaculum luteum]|uniref:universal stress protein n=1 Tax=Aureibaculum luteum TaxID=1548456 RepID=UPI000E4D5EDB|nr:universal stress protein [Aureibaculum luteum]